MPAKCPICGQLMGQERDGRFWVHGSKTLRGRFVKCPMSGQKPQREFVQLELLDRKGET